jgi:enamine deaminase RidA (YjgF/YER057c/UK114 family)
LVRAAWVLARPAHVAGARRRALWYDTIVIEHFPSGEGLPRPNGYSHATAGTGRLVAVSGQLPLDAAGNLVSATDALLQAQQVFHNLRIALAAAGAVPDDVLRLGFYLTDLDDLPAVRQARDAFLGGSTPPASSLVRVAGLVVAGARIEIDALAMTR